MLTDSYKIAYACTDNRPLVNIQVVTGNVKVNI